jgi:hypothetical protein
VTSLSAITLWILDRVLCDFWIRINAPVLHSIFHVLIFFSSSSSIVLFAYFKAAEKVSHLAPNIAYWPNNARTLPEFACIPYVYFSRLENKDSDTRSKMTSSLTRSTETNSGSYASSPSSTMTAINRSEITSRRDLKQNSSDSPHYKSFI